MSDQAQCWEHVPEKRHLLPGDCLQEGWYDGRPHSFQVYAPSRTCVVYGPADYEDPLKEYCEENPDVDECREYDE